MIDLNLDMLAQIKANGISMQDIIDRQPIIKKFVEENSFTCEDVMNFQLKLSKPNQ